MLFKWKSFFFVNMVARVNIFSFSSFSESWWNIKKAIYTVFSQRLHRLSQECVQKYFQLFFKWCSEDFLLEFALKNSTLLPLIFSINKEVPSRGFVENSLGIFFRNPDKNSFSCSDFPNSTSSYCYMDSFKK